jgi:hypothetical protein
MTIFPFLDANANRQDRPASPAHVEPLQLLRFALPAAETHARVPLRTFANIRAADQ